MADQRQNALAEFKRIMKWIGVVAVLMVVGALSFLKLTGELHAPMVIATTIGVFVSVLLGCGLFAAAFFSEKSGLDEAVTHATVRPAGRRSKSPERKNS